MEIPVLICYTIEHALSILKKKGISNITVIRTGDNYRDHHGVRVERVIGQREKNGFVELIVS